MPKQHLFGKRQRPPEPTAHLAQIAFGTLIDLSGHGGGGFDRRHGWASLEFPRLRYACFSHLSIICETLNPYLIDMADGIAPSSIFRRRRRRRPRYARRGAARHSAAAAEPPD